MYKLAKPMNAISVRSTAVDPKRTLRRRFALSVGRAAAAACCCLAMVAAVVKPTVLASGQIALAECQQNRNRDQKSVHATCQRTTATAKSANYNDQNADDGYDGKVYQFPPPSLSAVPLRGGCICPTSSDQQPASISRRHKQSCRSFRCSSSSGGGERTFANCRRR